MPPTQCHTQNSQGTQRSSSSRIYSHVTPDTALPPSLAVEKCLVLTTHRLLAPHLPPVEVGYIQHKVDHIPTLELDAHFRDLLGAATPAALSEREREGQHHSAGELSSDRA